MSTLLEQASLVMIPSGYKEDVVYSQIPTNGNGDLSFTRASNGTRVNSAGLVEVVPWNLVSYSEQFQNAAWTKQNSGTTFTLTDNFTTAPNGTTTACKYTWTAMDSAGKYFSFYQPITNSVGDLPVTFSVYMKGALGGEKLYIYGNAYEGLQLVTLTTEWVRYEITFDTGSANILVYIGGEFGAGGMTTLAAGTAYIWGAQLNIGSTAKPYFPTTDRLNVPRLTYQNGGGGCPSLLLEKQSTNLAFPSEDLTALTSGGMTNTANQTTSPDGTQNADKSTIGSTTRYYDVVTAPIVTTTIGAVYTTSFFAKKGTGIEAIYFYQDNGGRAAKFNLNNGAYIGHAPADGYSAFTSYSSESFGNGWYRFTATYTATTSTGQFVIGVSTNTNDSVTPLTGNGTDFVYVWGLQYEASSYATSYIPTTSSSATRVADTCSKTGISSLIGQTEGTLYWEGEIKLGEQSRLIFVSDGSSSNFINTLVSASGEISGAIRASLITSTAFTSSALTAGVHKIAFGYKANDSALYIDGVSISGTSGADVPATSRLDIGSRFGTDSFLNSGTSQAILFPTRLTNAELASLTTI